MQKKYFPALLILLALIMSCQQTVITPPVTEYVQPPFEPTKTEYIPPTVISVTKVVPTWTKYVPSVVVPSATRYIPPPVTPSVTEYIPPTIQPGLTPTKYVPPPAPPTHVNNSCPGAPPQRIKVNQRGYVCTKSDRVRLRNDPFKSSNTIAYLTTGTQFTVVGGPSCSDNWSWWNVRLDDNTIGWLAEGGDAVDPYFICPMP